MTLKPLTESAEATIEEVDEVLKSMSSYHDICTQSSLLNFWLDVRLSLMGYSSTPTPVGFEKEAAPN